MSLALFYFKSCTLSLGCMNYMMICRNDMSWETRCLLDTSVKVIHLVERLLNLKCRWLVTVLHKFTFILLKSHRQEFVLNEHFVYFLTQFPCHIQVCGIVYCLIFSILMGCKVMRQVTWQQWENESFLPMLNVVCHYWPWVCTCCCIFHTVVTTLYLMLILCDLLE